MTLPSLTAKYKKHQVETSLAKFYSSINQAVRLSEVENGDYKNWECGGNSCSLTTKEWYDLYLNKYIKYVKTKDSASNNHYKIYYNDGSSADFFTINNIVHIEFKPISRQSSTTGVNSFLFLFYPNVANGASSNPDKNKAVEPYKWGWDGTEKKLYDKCDTDGQFCAALIQYNGWKIPNDYPYKF